MKFKSDFYGAQPPPRIRWKEQRMERYMMAAVLPTWSVISRNLERQQSLCQLWATSTGLLWITLSGHVDIRSASDWFMWIIRPRSGL